MRKDRTGRQTDTAEFRSWGMSMSLRHGTRGGTVPVWKLRRWLPTVLPTMAGLGGPVNWVLPQPPAATAPATQPKTDPGSGQSSTDVYGGVQHGSRIVFFGRCGRGYPTYPRPRNTLTPISHPETWES